MKTSMCSRLVRSCGARLGALPILLVLLLLGFSPRLPAAPLVQLSMTEIGDPGNAADIPANGGLGAVSIDYYISTYEVSNSQYATFLSTVASVTSNPDLIALYSGSMPGISRTGSGTSGDPYDYTVTAGMGNLPVVYVSWNDAARFVNWVNNGAQTGSGTETGAYDMSLTSPTRNSSATWWLPSLDEWYKAAYYKGGSTSAGYFAYPTSTDTAPASYTGDLNPSSATANFNNQTSSPYPDTVPVDSFANSASPYGTLNQGGNVNEWNDSLSGTDRGFRGGSWFSPNDEALQSDYGVSNTQFLNPTTEGPDLGFRVASSVVPEPSTVVLLLLGSGVVGFLFWRRQRQKRQADIAHEA